MDLILVESPGKLKTISKIMGSNYTVLATIGHMTKINDSGAYKTGIDCKNNFKVDYVYDTTKKENIAKIKEAAKNANKIYVCSDADREGHAIAVEIQNLLSQYKSKLIRTTFNEITEKAIKDAIKNPTGFDNNMANAAESRAILDKLIGYRVSPVVLTKVSAKSAGRVQSALLNLLAEKERTIQNFKPVKYWEVYLDYKKGNSNLEAKLCQIDTKKVDRLNNKEIADDVVKNCKSGNYAAEKIISKEKLIEPKLPLTTAAMQQLASNLYGWSPSRTQKSAQMLYEAGLCTYIRTDAVRFAPEFIEDAKTFINKTYGAGLFRGLNIPEEKNKDAQNAHESIRPTHLEKTPAVVSGELEGDALKLYKMIFNYSLASLFVPAKVKDTDVIIKNDKYYFKSSGRQVIFESFLKLTNEIDDAKKLPDFKVGEKINDKELRVEEKETNPPPRYSEAGLVKLMQDTGIGRPSTFAPTIETLKKRGYITIEKKAVYVSEIGMKLDEFLTKYFPDTFKPEYTSKMEEQLDKISSGELTELKFLSDFWKEFEPIILGVVRTVNKERPKPEKVEGKVCPKCGKPVVKRIGRYGEFYACSSFPHCRYTEKIDNGESQPELPPCPMCSDGHMKERKNKKGQIFYGCTNWPKCNCIITKDKMPEYLESLKLKVDLGKDKE